ncbi:UV radiation resistance protein and autophagy-related subunit 14-domain-containing protein [Pseudomassariella vexata]|uniref:Autophagy-related protein 14 n=1 Tax=Pseudomassariella vexata TaxID=1141098 RepID=A0A1Y2D889_9PEZI|nr:UV radiation resistance protein and autophagy-related subunit 14-domain-containing protein [Pseudomassariella vexata]ORY55483.1 UV radiation resistance protein and autophagy-related subunit 14-domain-containing protein [Pseudomassariella vexata]
MDSRASAMNCEICRRQHHPQRLPFFCALDARNVLYEGRIMNARVLMEMEELEQRVNNLLLDSQPDSATPASNRNSFTYVENCVSETQKAKERTAQIIAVADKLKEEVKKAREEIKERKEIIARRKSDLASVSQGIEPRRNRELEETKKAIRMIKYTWDREYEAMIQYRAALCTEVAKLYRLQRVRHGNPVRFEYKIGGIDVLDLDHLNKGTPPEQISASLAHVTHLLWLTSHYLSIRLPAEITLPHNDYPRPTVFSLASSYRHGQVPFPGTTPLPQDPRDRRPQSPHPRPLFLDKPLSILAKEDAQTYTSFLEGVCLLAYNIVWLCRTQGISVGDNSSNIFEDFASMGRNLYNLLIGSSRNQQPPTLVSEANTSAGRNGATVSGDAADISKPIPRMGAFSHGTSHTFLSGTAGQEFTRTFRLPNPVKLADKLKARLVNEALVPEWELIEDEELGPNDLDDGVFVGGTPQLRLKGQKFGLESYMSVNTVRGGGGGVGEAKIPSDGVSQKDREKGTSGWTKIR